MAATTAPFRISDLAPDRRDIQVYTGSLSRDVDHITIEAEKNTPAVEVVCLAAIRLKLPSPENLELAEVFYSAGQVCKERRMDASENPIKIQHLWPKIMNHDDENGLVTEHRFYIRKKEIEISNRSYSWSDYKFEQPDHVFNTLKRQLSTVKEYPDLCNLPDLNEKTMLGNLERRFDNGDIYTYIGSILIAINPFKFFPIYNPKYVKMYQNHHYSELPPHIFAIADAAFFNMLRSKQNQCIVISGESGSGKTESTNLLLHHLTALSHKGIHASGVEQTILGAGPVLEAFGNSVTVHNSNSSRFGKFIQINYKENGMVHGAVVEKYLLEKSRIVSQTTDERNYHVFYYLLNGAPDELKSQLDLTQPDDYIYLQHESVILDAECEQDEQHEFSRLQQSMELVGFSTSIQNKIFSILSAVLHLGNIKFKKKEYRFDESVSVKNVATVTAICDLLKVQTETLTEALTQKKTTAGDETVVINYKMADAIAARDAMAKCLYGTLFDWIVLKVNRALLAKRHSSEHEGNSIGILDIFGFEDFTRNSFEQFCINFANERLQYYFNQHIFKLEQEEYQREGIDWKNVDFIDNTGCLELFTKKSIGLFGLLDEECNLPGASGERLLSKFNQCQRNNSYYSVPQMKEMAFIIEHYAGSIKYQIDAFREKNTDLVRQDIVRVLKNSSLTFVRELVGFDPVAMARWGVLRAFFRSYFAFRKAGEKRRHDRDQENVMDLFMHRCSIHGKRQSDSLGVNRDPLSDLGNRKSPSKEFLDRLEIDSNMSNFDMRQMRRATKLLSKRSTVKEKPRTLYRDMKALKSLACRTRSGGSKHSMKKAPATVAAQFQTSLTKLMDTLDQANPFFIRCIKSNANRLPCYFDNATVMRQLRYTGMLATVRIRQCGYNYRLKFREFIQMYGLLLPSGQNSSEDEVRQFLRDMSFRSQNYQIGISKVFLREVEKTLLDDTLHRTLMSRIVKLQRWVKARLQRCAFLRLQAAAHVIQVCGRRFMAMKLLDDLRTEHQAAVDIQRYWRGYVKRRAYVDTLACVIIVQSAIRGWLTRTRFALLLKEKRQHEKVIARRSLVNGEIVARRYRIEAAWGAGRPASLTFSNEQGFEADLSNRRSPDWDVGYYGDRSTDSTISSSQSSSSSLIQQTGKYVTSPDAQRDRNPVKRSDHIVVRRNKVQQIVAPPLTPPLTPPPARDEFTIESDDSTRDDPENDVRTRGKFSQLSADTIREIEDMLMKKEKQRSKFHLKQRLAYMISGASKRVKRDTESDTSGEQSSDATRARSPDTPRMQIDPVPIDGHKTRMSRKKKLSRKISNKMSNKISSDSPAASTRDVGTGGSNWSVAGMSQWQYPDDLIITSLAALRHLDEFITKKKKVPTATLR